LIRKKAQASITVRMFIQRVRGVRKSNKVPLKVSRWLHLPWVGLSAQPCTAANPNTVLEKGWCRGRD
jgi:hypothetical protein